MKRLLLITVALLLSVSSWGEVLAAALCPHMQASHACCVAKASGTHRHGQVMAHHDGMMEGMEMTVPTTPAIEEAARAITEPVGLCGHCMSRSEPPARFIIVARADAQSKKELRAAPTQTLGLPSPFSASSTLLITSRQNAPPGDQSSRHVLINVFRI
jgi:hypothetical protein